MQIVDNAGDSMWSAARYFEAARSNRSKSSNLAGSLRRSALRARCGRSLKVCALT